MISIPGVPDWAVWTGFVVLILALLELDIGLFNRKDHIISVKEALGWSAFWFSLAMAFNWWVYASSGTEKALEFLTGYLIELSLSIDNLFVFLLIFSAFAIRREYQHRVLFWGIMGAIVMRGLFIALGSALVSRFDWVFYLFGLIILWGAYHMAFQKEKKFNPEENLAIRMVRRFFPVSGKDNGHDFFVKEKGRTMATILFVALVTIELTDVVFATDSIPAIFGITTDPFIVFTSNIFAILGLRSMYFALAGLHAMFAYLKTGLAAILAFIGVKMLLHDVWHPPTYLTLIVVVIILAVSILASFLFVKKRVEHGGPMRHAPEHGVEHDHGVHISVTRKGVRKYPEQK